MKSKKAGAPIAIVLLIVATLVLVSFTTFIFLTRQQNAHEIIYIGRISEEVYAKENLINFYIQEILDKSSKNANAIQEVLDNFNSELNKYRGLNGDYLISELGQLSGQLNVDNFKLEDNKVSVSFKIKIDTKVLKDDKKLMSASYIYTKTFESFV